MNQRIRKRICRDAKQFKVVQVVESCWVLEVLGLERNGVDLTGVFFQSILGFSRQTRVIILDWDDTSEARVHLGSPSASGRKNCGSCEASQSIMILTV